ncbi:hypothetical protein LTR84_001720 [Exophiala bonariae]|uniref:F-box domain-containing protein n=1 Tax=Exophiala bonariae TaxID=1690606 RepID=A0AAV9NBF7_9EURO|nr:hypothetical protein LTR84_001720 [Exophiala bonariae]
MTSITSLPPEILSQILSLRLLSRSELTKCALVCKDFNTTVTANLYRDLCFDLPHFRYGMEEHLERNEQLHKIQLLTNQLAVNQRLADRVHSLVLHGSSNWLSENVALPSLPDRLAPQEDAPLDHQTFLKHTPVPLPQMVSKLTQLKVLNLDVGFSNLLRRQAVYFPKLQVVVLWSLNERFSHNHFWMAQPNLLEICFNHGSVSIPPDFDCYNSSVSKIVLDSNRGFPSNIARLVQAPKALKSFKWRFYSNCCLRACAHRSNKLKGNKVIPGCYKLQDSVNSILTHIRHSLQTLVLTYGHHSTRCSLSPVLIPSMRGFDQLRELRIEASMLLGSQTCPSRDSVSTNIFRPGYELAGIIPTCLETLHLEVEREQMDRDEKNYCKDIVRGIVQRQKKRDLHLGHFIIEEINPRYASNCQCVPKDLCHRARSHIEINWNLGSIWEMEKACTGVGILLSYIWRRGSFEDPIKLILRSGGLSLHATTEPWDWTMVGV